MFNKKLLAASLAVAFSSSTFAAVDLTDADTVVTFAEELIEATDINANGRVVVDNTTGAIDATFPAGFTVAQGTSKYIRVKLSDAVFGSVPTLTAGGVAGFSAILSQGGAVGDTSAIFEITSATADILADSEITLDVTTYNISQSNDVFVSATTYNSAPDAVSEVSALATTSGKLATIASGNTGEFVVATDVTSTVTSTVPFTEFSEGAGFINATTATLGNMDIDALVSASVFDIDGTAVTAADLLTATTQDVYIEGDFSFGTWTLDVSAACAGTTTVALVNDADDMGATATGVDLTTDYYLCVTVDGTETINKGTYSAMLVTDEVSDDFGRIMYDTTSIEVPYLTTFSSYNQRIYLVNYGSGEVSYTMSFVSEDGVTATAGAAATGTIPAGEMVTLRATDVVTLTGKTRTSAIIEVEAVDEDIAATTQTVNLSDGTTDTVVLN